MEAAINPISDPTAPPPLSRKEKLWKIGRWVLGGLTLLSVFTFWKLPDAKIQQWVVSEIVRGAYDQAGIELHPRSTSLSWFLGPSLRMNQVTAQTSSGKGMTLDGIKVSPSLFSLVIGRLSANVSVWKGRSELDLSVSSSSSGFRVIADADLPTLDFVGAKGVVGLTADVRGKPNKPQTFEGKITVTLSKIEVPEQELQFLKLPSFKISTGSIRIKVEQGVGRIEEFSLGKEGDDLLLKGQGEATLSAFLEQSNLNLKGTLKLSPRIAGALPLLEALLGPGKQADGSFAFRLSGSPAAPFFSPGT